MSVRLALLKMIEEYGHAAVALELAAAVGWQARHYPQAQADRIAVAARELAFAADILEQIEKEDTCRNDLVGLHPARKDGEK